METLFIQSLTKILVTTWLLLDIAVILISLIQTALLMPSFSSSQIMQKLTGLFSLILDSIILQLFLSALMRAGSP